MTPEKQHTFLLGALAILAAIAIALLYLLLDIQEPTEGYQEPVRRLANDVLPSLMATLVAAVFAVFFANRLSRRRAHEVKARDLSAGIVSVAGSWKLRDWRHDYAESYESEHPREAADTDADWYRARDAYCKAEEANDRLWKHSENVRINQIGDSVEVYFSHRDSDLRGWVHYRIDGRLLGRVLTGNWREIRSESDVFWFGTVQLLVVGEGDRKTGKSMLGRWTGTHSKGGSIRCGVWEFVEATKRKREPSWPTGITDEGQVAE